MTPHQQLIRHDAENGQHGDCHRTCIAVILGLEPADVPHFCDQDNPDWDKEEAAWLAERGLVKASVPIHGDFTLDWILESMGNVSYDVAFILGGQSKIGANHSVVIYQGRIFCDPSGNGIVGPCDDGWWWLNFYCQAPAQNEAGQ